MSNIGNINEGSSFGIDSEELFVEAFVPFANFEIENEHIEISGLGECILKTGRYTELGTADYYEYKNDCKNVILYTGIYKFKFGNLLISQCIKNKNEKNIYISEIGIRSFGKINVKYGEPNDWVLSSLHGDKSGGAFISEKLPSENEQTEKMYKGFNLPCPELPQDERHTDGGWRTFEESVALFSQKTNRGVLIMPVNSPEAFMKCAAYVDDGQLNYIELESDMSNILLKSGQSHSAQDFAILNGDFETSINSVMANYSKYLGNRKDKPIPFGWCSWYSVYSGVKEDDVLGAIEFFANHKNEFTPDFIQLDDGYQKMMGEWNPNEKFPNAFSNIVGSVKGIGARAGIWVAPIIAHENSEILQQHPDWIAKNENGKPAVVMGNWGGNSYAMDATNPSVIAFVKKILLDKMNDGFTYFKMDFNNIYVNGKTAYDNSKTSLQVYRNLYKIYREVLGNDNYLLSCSGFTRGTIGYADGSRIAGDIDAGWNDTPTTIYPGLQNAPIKAAANGVLYACDPDVTHLTVKTKRLTEKQRRIWHSFVCLFGGVEQTSELKNDLENGIDQLRILMPPCKQTAKPVFPCADPDNSRIGFNVIRGFESYGVYLLWNPNDSSNYFETRLSSKLNQIGEKFHVFSFWEQQYCGIHSADYVIENLRYGEGKLLRFTPVSDEPQIIGTTFHMGMGTNEVNNVLFNGKQFTIILNDEGAKSGSVYIYFKGSLKLIEAINCLAEQTTESCIHNIKVKNRRENQQLTFVIE